MMNKHATSFSSFRCTSNNLAALFISLLCFVILQPPNPNSYASSVDEKHTTSAKIEILAKHFTSGYLQTVEDYVDYQIKVTNIGSNSIANESLWALLVSNGNITHSNTSFSLSFLDPGESKVFALGPLKMREAGLHSFYVGINKKGDPLQPNDVLLNYPSDKPLDSFFVYEKSFLQFVLPIAAMLVLMGIAIVIGFLFYRRKQINA